MPAKWQQWMPFKIDAFRGSPSVQAMHPAARAGYLYLLATAWQTDDCTISDDPLELAEMSGLGDELWSIHGPRILRKFNSNGQGKLCNMVLLNEWKEAQKVFASRQLAAERTNKQRWSNGDRSVTDHGPHRSADTRTGTVTGTETLTKKQRLSANGKPSQTVIEIYSAYPRHIAPVPAYKAIAKALAETSRENILSAIKRFKRELAAKGTEAQFIPHPATWFNQGRYRDEPVAELFTNGNGHPAPKPPSSYELQVQDQYKRIAQARADADKAAGRA